MSIYSGFATRNLQQNYDQHVCDLLFLMQKRLLKFYQNLQADEDKFFSIFSQLHHQIIHLQKSKYLEPKSSFFVNQIYGYLKERKQQRSRCPQQDLKKFQRSLALKAKRQTQAKLNQFEVNNFIKRSAFSFGKIKRQLDNSCSKVIDLNVQPIDRKVDRQSKNFQNEQLNPQQTKLISEQRLTHRSKRIFSSKGYRNSKSFQEEISQNSNEPKIKIPRDSPAEQIVKQYLQKTNKNYLRGYRKRKINHQITSSNQNEKSIFRQKRRSHC